MTSVLEEECTVDAGTNHMLTLAIIVGSVALGGTVVTVASLRFTKWYMECVEGYELPPPPKPKTRLDTLQVFTSAVRVEKCPFCGSVRRENAKSAMSAHWFRVQKESNNLGVIQTQATKDKTEGTTTVIAVDTLEGVRLYQGCNTCGGEWLLKRPEKKVRDDCEKRTD